MYNLIHNCTGSVENQGRLERIFFPEGFLQNKFGAPQAPPTTAAPTTAAPVIPSNAEYCAKDQGHTMCKYIVSSTSEFRDKEANTS